MLGVSSSRIVTLSMVHTDDNELDSIFRRISRASSSAECSLSEVENNEMIATLLVRNTENRKRVGLDIGFAILLGRAPFFVTVETGNRFPVVRAPLGEHNRFKVNPMLQKRVAVLDSTHYPEGTQHLAER